MLRLVQFRDERGEMRVAACDDEGLAHVVKGRRRPTSWPGKRLPPV
ncbi:hypothetical protein HED49_11430 [Ochrobactrum daejeonense]|nr:hypothetical protein [Brucella daejeonensis]